LGRESGSKLHALQALARESFELVKNSAEANWGVHQNHDGNVPDAKALGRSGS